MLFNVVFLFQYFCTILFTATVVFFTIFLDLLIFSGPSKSVEFLIYFFWPCLLAFVLFSNFMFQDDGIERAV